VYNGVSGTDYYEDVWSGSEGGTVIISSRGGPDNTHYAGTLDTALRYFVYVKNPDYFVIFDEVEAPSSAEFTFCMNGRALAIDDDVITVDTDKMKSVVLEPDDFSSLITTYDVNKGWITHDYDVIRFHDTVDSTAANFLTVHFPGSTVLPTTKIDQSNVKGTIVTTGAGLDLILFSTDGNHVSENIELGGNYQSADGNPYIFNGTQVLADFDTYTVMRLEPATGGNRSPMLDSIGNKSVREQQALQFTVSATDPDGDPLTYSASNLPAGASFNSTSRTFSWTPSSGQAGTYPDVLFIVSDNEPLTDSESITITVTPNSPPVLNPIGNQSTHLNWPLQFTVSANDSDGDPLTYSASNLPSWASFNPATRTFSGTPDQMGSYSDVYFEVSDGILTDSEYITITITANNAPTLGSIGNKTVDEGQLLSFIISATDPDNDTLSYSASGLPSWASFDPGTRTFSWTPAYNQAGTYTNVLFSVSDSELTDSESINITVNNINRPPVLANIGNKTVTEDQPLQFTISATDPDGDSLTYSTSNLPTGANFETSTLTFSWTPDSTQVGSYPDVHFEVTDSTAIASENITITVNASTPAVPASGGGGGGEGGGGGAPGVTLFYNYIDESGRFIEDVIVKSSDRKVELVIPEDTVGKQLSGSRLGSIAIKETTDTPSQPVNANFIELVYDIVPNGASFEPPITLLFHYDESLIPEGVPENNLVLAWFDRTTDEWIYLETTVDPETNVAKAEISHFSDYTVMAPIHPASFTITDLSVTPTAVYPGEEVSITTLVTNTSSLTGSHEVSLTVNDTITETREVTLDGGDSELVTFNLTADTVGEYVVEVDELKSTFTVNEPKAPAAFITNNLEIHPVEVTIGESVIISILVSNNGDLAGSYEVSLLIDGSVFQTKEITLNGGEMQEASFQVTADTAGEFKVTIDGLSGSYDVKTSPSPETEDKTSEKLEIDSFSVAPSYDETTSKLVYARIVYQMKQTYNSFPNTRLMLKVFRDGEFLEQVPLFTLSQLQSDGKTGELNYIPTTGWLLGEYSFRVELYEGENLIQNVVSPQLIISPESRTTAVNLGILGGIIGGAIATIVIVIGFVMYRRRYMLKS
jgi:hypothetical protein